MKKGFTLIELLAVIVILAIIALIATPIILGIINDARDESNKRSIELYAKSIESHIAKSQLDGTEIPSGDLSSTFLNTVEYDGSRVECETNKLNADGTVYLSGCTVGGKAVDYAYGNEGTSDEENDTQTMYYAWYLSGIIGETDAPAQPSTTPPEDKDFYLGYNISNNKVSAAYVCFKLDNDRYCLSGEPNAYSDNKRILDEAFEDFENACNLQDNSVYTCYTSLNGPIASAFLSGGVQAFNGGSSQCYIDSNRFTCEDE